MDGWISACLLPLAIWLLISGMDDLLVDLVWLFGRPAAPFPSEDELSRTPEKRIAVFVPLWREHRVIRNMLERNLAANRYENYEFFVGCYPNDDLTVAEVREMEAASPKVHLALCPHPGTTADLPTLSEWRVDRSRFSGRPDDYSTRSRRSRSGMGGQMTWLGAKIRTVPSAPTKRSGPPYSDLLRMIC